MAFDGITTADLVRELNTQLTGARISRLLQPEKDELFLVCKSREGARTLFLSASASLPLAYLTAGTRPAPMTAPKFCMFLRKYIGGGRIERVWQPSLERIIRIRIEHRDEMGDLCTRDLILELMGKHSNLILVDSQETILDSIKHIPGNVSSVREVLPGKPYFVPQTQDKKDPLTASEEECMTWLFADSRPLSKALYTTFTGISPVVAQELCYRASLDPDLPASGTSGADRLHLTHQFRLLMDEVQAGHFSRQIYLGEDEVPVEYASVPLHEYEDFAGTKVLRFESVSQMLEQYYAMKERHTRIRQKSASLRQVVTTALSRARRKLQLQTAQMKDTQKMDRLRLYGELLHTYGYEAQPGDSSLTVTDYHTGEEVTIPLDPQMSAFENAARYFDRYGKLKRTAQALTEQIRQTQMDVDHLESVQTFLDLAADEADLQRVREDLAAAGYVHESGGGKRKHTGRPQAAGPWHYRDADGNEFYVGRNNIQNEEVTFKIASADDWWFHAQKIPGSHVVLRAHQDPIPDHVYEEAAALAAWYSKGRDGDRVEVDYVQRREVRKVAASRPGFVIYHTHYSMSVRPGLEGLMLCDG